MKLAAVLDLVESLSPPALAEPWDKVGLHVGERGRDVTRALLCIDLTEAVMREAAAQRCELVVAYHPPIFEPVATLTDAEAKGRVLMEAVRRGIAVYSPHTALDAARGGVTDWLCEGLGAGDVRVIQRSAPGRMDYKLVTFVPPTHAAQVRDAMFAAGAGEIGAYSRCSFSHPGTGTFQGSAGTDPFIGQAGRFETVEELRIEMACRPALLDKAIAALKAAHPYEEPAYDVFHIRPPEVDDVGAGRVLTLAKAVRVSVLVKRVKSHLGVKHVAVADAGLPVRRIAVCPGAGGPLLTPLRDVDVLFTGEMRHHDVLAANARGVSVVLAGHTQTERPYLPVYRERLREACRGKVAWRVSRGDVAPMRVA